MASPVYANATGTVRLNAASTNWIGDIPASVATGDLMVAQIVSRSGLATISTVPTGWVAIPTNPTVGATAISQYVYGKIATASDTAGSTYTWTSATSTTTTVTTSRITGADATTPLHASAGTTDAGGTGTKTFPAISTTVADTLILNMVCVAAGGSYTDASWTVGTERWDSSTGVGGTSRTAGGGSGPRAPTGSTGTFTVTQSTGNESVVHTVAIAPAAAAGPAQQLLTQTPIRYTFY